MLLSTSMPDDAIDGLAVGSAAFLVKNVVGSILGNGDT